MNYIRKVMDTREGREFINELLAFCGVFKADAISTEDAFMKQGRKQVGLFLYSMIQEEDRTLLYKMMDEAFLKTKEILNEQASSRRDSITRHETGSDFDYRQYYRLDSEDRGHRADEGLGL